MKPHFNRILYYSIYLAILLKEDISLTMHFLSKDEKDINSIINNIFEFLKQIRRGNNFARNLETKG